MSKSPNESQYKQIQKLRRTGRPVYKLCKELGVTYQGYHNWEKLYGGSAEAEPAELLTLSIPAVRIADCIRKGHKELVLSLSEILPNLSDEQKRLLYEVRGRVEMERILEQHDASQPSSWEVRRSFDDYENNLKK